jgi:hypothetical protein
MRNPEGVCATAGHLAVRQFRKSRNRENLVVLSGASTVSSGIDCPPQVSKACASVTRKYRPQL